MLRTTPWRVLWIGTLIGLALLHQAPALAQQTVSQLGWACSSAAATGLDVEGNTCPPASQRWDYGADAGLLYATCAGSCTSWRDATWRPWAEATAQVFLCRSPKVPGPWSDCSDEGFAARAQVATIPAPPPPPPAVTHPPGNTYLDAHALGSYGVLLTWEPVTLRIDGSPTTEPIDYRVETAGGDILGEVRDLDFEISEAPPGRRCYRVRAIEATRASPYTSQQDNNSCQTVSTKITIASSEGLDIRRGASTTISWSHNGLPMDCSATWAPDEDLAQAGELVVTPTVATLYQIHCSVDGANSIAAVGIQLLAYVPPAFPACLPADLSLTSAAVADATGELRSYLGSIGLNEIVSTDRTTTAEGWPCDMATGYSYAWFVIDWDSGDARCWRNVSFRSVIQRPFWEAVWDVCSRPLSLDELALGAKLRAYYAARFQVRAGAAARAVYRQNGDGSRGAQLRINTAGQVVDAGGTLQTIAAGKRCQGKKRTAVPGSSTRFHLVSGETSVQGRVLPADVFADCSILKPPVAGWPQT